MPPAVPPIATRFPLLSSTLFSSQRTSTINSPILLIAGPNTLLPQPQTLSLANALRAITARLSLPLLFKASFDKANRTSHLSPRGPGLSSLPLLSHLRTTTALPILTDVHETSQIPATAGVADALQIPAFLCRQTDLITAAATSGRVLNIKKGQFASPAVALAAAAKARAASPGVHVMLTERGTTFGHGGLVVDVPALEDMRTTGAMVVMDATHAAQAPPVGGQGGEGRLSTGGDLKKVRALARAAVAAGVDAVFLEVFDYEYGSGDAVPPCDPQVQMPLDGLEDFLEELMEIARASRAERGWEVGAKERREEVQTGKLAGGNF